MLDIPATNNKETNKNIKDKKTTITDNNETVNPKNTQIINLSNEDIWLVSLSCVVFVLLILVVWLII